MKSNNTARRLLATRTVGVISTVMAGVRSFFTRQHSLFPVLVEPAVRWYSPPGSGEGDKGPQGPAR